MVLVKGYGHVIQKCRLEQGVSIRQVAEASGIGRSTLSRWERGEAHPRCPELISVLRVLKPSAPDNDLLHLTPKQTKPSTAHFRCQRHQNGQRLADVASEVGVSVAALSRYETGSRTPSPGLSQKIETAIHMEHSCSLAERLDWLLYQAKVKPNQPLDHHFVAADVELRSLGDQSAALTCLRAAYASWLSWWYRDIEAVRWVNYEMSRHALHRRHPGLARLLRTRANYEAEFGAGPERAARFLYEADRALGTYSVKGFVLRELAAHVSEAGYHRQALATLDRAKRAPSADEEDGTHHTCCCLVEASIWLKAGEPEKAHNALPTSCPDDDMLRLSLTSISAKCLAELGAKEQARRALSEQITRFQAKGYDHFASTLATALVRLTNR